MALTASSRAPGLHIGDGVEIDPTAEIGANVVLHDGTRIGAGCVVDDGAVVGKRPRLSARSRAPRNVQAPTVLEDGAIVCTSAIVYVGATLARNAILGDQTTMRDGAYLGEDSVLGKCCIVNTGARLGARLRAADYCGFATDMIVEDDVFIGPRLSSVNDQSMGDVDHPLRSPTIRRGARIGGRVLLLPGVEVGAGAVIAAGSLVTRDVPPGMFALGSPARVLRAVST